MTVAKKKPKAAALPPSVPTIHSLVQAPKKTEAKREAKTDGKELPPTPEEAKLVSTLIEAIRNFSTQSPVSLPLPGAKKSAGSSQKPPKESQELGDPEEEDDDEEEDEEEEEGGEEDGDEVEMALKKPKEAKPSVLTTEKDIPVQRKRDDCEDECETECGTCDKCRKPRRRKQAALASTEFVIIGLLPTVLAKDAPLEVKAGSVATKPTVPSKVMTKGIAVESKLPPASSSSAIGTKTAIPKSLSLETSRTPTSLAEVCAGATARLQLSPNVSDSTGTITLIGDEISFNRSGTYLIYLRLQFTATFAFDTDPEFTAVSAPVTVTGGVSFSRFTGFSDCPRSSQFCVSVPPYTFLAAPTSVVTHCFQAVSIFQIRVLERTRGRVIINLPAATTPSGSTVGVTTAAVFTGQSVIGIVRLRPGRSFDPLNPFAPFNVV